MYVCVCIYVLMYVCMLNMRGSPVFNTYGYQEIYYSRALHSSDKEHFCVFFYELWISE